MNRTAVSILVAMAVVTPQAQQHTESEAEIDQHVLAALLDASKEQCALASAAVDELARLLAQAKREKDVNRVRAALVTSRSTSAFGLVSRRDETTRSSRQVSYGKKRAEGDRCPPSRHVVW
jgi:hypothetical protein